MSETSCTKKKYVFQHYTCNERIDFLVLIENLSNFVFIEIMVNPPQKPIPDQVHLKPIVRAVVERLR